MTTPAGPCPTTISSHAALAPLSLLEEAGWRAGAPPSGRPVAARSRPEAGLSEHYAPCRLPGPPGMGGAHHPQRPAPGRGCRENTVLQSAPDLGAAGSRTGHARLSPALAPVGGKLRLPAAGLVTRIEKRRGRRRRLVRARCCRAPRVAMASGARRPPEWRSGVRSVRALGGRAWAAGYSRREPRAGFVVSGRPSCRTFGRLGWRGYAPGGTLLSQLPAGRRMLEVHAGRRLAGWGNSRVQGSCHNLLMARGALSTAR